MTLAHHPPAIVCTMSHKAQRAALEKQRKHVLEGNQQLGQIVGEFRLKDIRKLGEEKV